MKRTILLLFAFLPLFISAKIWTVDNTPGSGADTTSLQGCIDRKASNGDTIILMPSNIGYGSISITTKKLFIYSRGHSNNNLDKDRSATIHSITFSYSGSNTSAGSTLKGVKIVGGLTIYVNNIHIQNCYSSYASSINGGSNNLIEGCVFDLGPYYAFDFSGSANNNILAHNYFVKHVSSGSWDGTSYRFINDGNSSNLIINNFFAEVVSGTASVSKGGFVFFDKSFAKIYNNILWSNVSGRTRFDTLNSGSAFKNNLTYSDKNKPTNLAGTGNINDTMPLFEGGYNSSLLPIYRASNDMRLKSTSPGRNAGTDSTDVGLFGGNYKFSIEGNVPGIAVFDDFEVLNPIIKKGGTLKVRINARKPE